MQVRTKDWLKFGVLVASVFLFGLAFSAALDLPRPTQAASLETVQGTPVIATAAPAAPRTVPLAGSAADLNETFVSVVEHVKPAVVYIQAERRQTGSNRLPRGFDDFFRQLPPGWEDYFQPPRGGGQGRPRIEQGSGTGFIVSRDGYIITNNHVVEGADRVRVRLPDNRQFEAQVVGTDPSTDIAVIKVAASNLPVTVLGNSDVARIGEWVLAIGNPLGQSFQFTVTAGIVSARGRQLPGLYAGDYQIQDFLQTDAAINPGNSGGPLVNLTGEVIGVNSAIASTTGYYSGYGFAIPINLARTVMDQLIQHGRVRRSVMGVVIRPIDPEDAELMGLREIKGVVVNDFNDDSPAKAAGMQVGDVIVAVDGKPIEYSAQLQQEVGFKTPGQTVRVEVARAGGQRRTLSVRLVEAPSSGRPVAAREEDARPDPTTPEEQLLGVSVQPLAQVRRVDAGLMDATGGNGLIVADVSPDGPAWGKLNGDPQGRGDIIVSINNTAVKSREDFTRVMRTVRPGQIVTLFVYTPTPQGNTWRWRGQVVRIRAKQ
jgi:serine protease Do